MSKFRKYIWFVIRHKWYVYQECRALGLGFWQAALHDMSKFGLSEFGAYKERFNGPLAKKEQWIAERTVWHLDLGAYNKATAQHMAEHEYDRARVSVDYDFQLAWLHHIHLNPHHWQFWIIGSTSNGVECVRMPEKYVKEMVADWRGVARAQCRPASDAIKWYSEQGDTLSLHPQTRSRVETLLGVKEPDSFRQVVVAPRFREAGT